MFVEELFYFIKERHAIYERRQQGLPKPWTDDPILQNYRFCNVYRELDTQTIWFAKNWREPYDSHPDLWFASLVFRFVNWNETAEELGFPVPWKPSHFVKVLRQRKERGEKVYSGAYMISTHGVKEEKHIYLAKSLSKIWDVRNEIRYGCGEPLNNFHKRLMGCFDVGSFVAAQVVADIKYAHPANCAPDFWSFAASGPGSRRGLNRILGRPVNAPWKEEEWRKEHAELQKEIDPLVRKAGIPRLHAQDLNNVECEFDKYERVRLGEGRPKATYNGVKV